MTAFTSHLGRSETVQSENGSVEEGRWYRGTGDLGDGRTVPAPRKGEFD